MKITLKEPTETHGVEIQYKDTTLLMRNVEDKFVGVSLTESSGPFELRRVCVEIHDLNALTEMSRFLDHQIKRMKRTENS